MKIIAIDAHIMDAELLAGGLAVKYSPFGHDIKFISLTGRKEDPLYEDMKRAGKILGASSECLQIRKEDLFKESVINNITILLLKEKPDFLITHWSGSWHPTHRKTHFLILESLQRILKISSFSLSLENILFGENFEDLKDFSPDLYIPLEEEEVNKWFSALEEFRIFREEKSLDFKGNLSYFPYKGFYKSMVRIHGLEIGVNYAIVFKKWHISKLL
ncbi:MAG: PIG-L family deacetylase [Dictyoglomaceae bacterium]|nr:PIG-L family deacetylase [Dictyoglomaceae bacterium]